MDIVQIVPRVPPAVDGISDYSLNLADNLLKTHRISSQFLACQKGIHPEPMINGFPVVGLPAQNTKAFLASLPENTRTVILHYTNYPYVLGKYDAPFWLLEALKAALKQRRFKLVVMFHEVPLTRMKDYLNPTQGLVALLIARMADVVLTNCSKSQFILSKVSKRPVANLPVFSTVGEPDSTPLLEKRKRRLIVFGGFSRFRVYKDSFQELVNACQLLEIEEICDVGPPLNLNWTKINGVSIVEMGIKSPEEISKLMLESIAGFFDYSRFPGYLAKSTILAAYCAHGLLPISARYNPSEADGIKMNKHYLVADRQSRNLRLGQLQGIADNACEWYRTHNQVKTAEFFASYVLEKSSNVLENSLQAHTTLDELSIL